MKTYEKGQPYRPAAIVQKVKNGIPTVLIIKGRRYVLDHQGGIRNETSRTLRHGTKR